MKKINDPKKLVAYIKTYDLQAYMNLKLVEISSLYSFDKEEHLITTGTTSDFLYFLVDGEAMVYSYSSDTQNVCINYVRPATIFGEASSLWQLLPKSSVKALTKCICVCIPLNTFRQQLLQDVCFLKNVCQILSYRLNTGINLENSLTEPVETRLAKFILTHQVNQIFSFQLTTCAVILNVSYRHLLRTITNFREEKILKKEQNVYVIQDSEQLKKIADNLSHLKK